MTDEGLLGMIGWTWVLVAWLIMAVLFAFAVTIAGWVRASWPGTTQVNQVTGVTEHGVGWWFLRILIGSVSFPVIGLAILAVVPVMEWVVEHWWAIPLTGAVIVAAFFLFMHLRNRPEQPVYVQPAPTQLTPFQQPQHGTPPALQPIWSLPEQYRDGAL
jgi:hypothetical protein